MAIEAYKKEQDRLEAEEAKRQNGGIEPDRRTLTMKEILGDEEKNSLLGKMLERTGDPADTQLFARITKKKPEAGDLDSLEKHRKVFEEKMKQVEAIGKELTPELALEVCQLSPDLSAILKNQIKAEDMVSMVKDNLGELAVTDPNRFAEMFDKIQKMQDFKKGDFKQLDDSVIELCKKQNINPGEYMKALAIEDAEKQDKALTDLVRKSWGEGNWGIVKNIFDVFGNVSKGDKQMLLDQKTKIDAVFADLANKKKDIGSVLAGTISENPDMREAMAKAMETK